MEKPNVILGCESHKDGSITSSEVFPENYDVLRNDRSRHGGCVFVLSNRETVLMTPETHLNTKCEIQWGSI